jgi:threonine synthase
MKYVKNYECTLCHKIYSNDQDILTCPSCGEKGILEINYDYNEMKKEVDKDYFKNNSDYSMLRYTPLMSINETTLETLDVGWTPLYKSNLLGLKNLYIKDDGINPTSSLKDRASLVACLKAIELGRTRIGCSSTGNAASSLAGNAAKLGLDAFIFVPERIPLGKLSQLVMYGSKVIKVEGDYKKAFQVSKDVIKNYDLYNRNAAINPHLVEGKKTVALEIAEQLNFEELDYVFVSVGDGCTIGGVYKGFYDLYNLDLITSIPKIIGVQAEGCAPFYKAFINDTELEETDENTIADSIAVGIPRNPVKGMNAVKKSDGFYMTVTDDEIIDAMVTLGSNEGIFAEPAGATGLAGLIKLVNENKIDKASRIAVLVTGNGLKDQKSVENQLDKRIVTCKENVVLRRMKDSPTIEGLLYILKEEVEKYE